MPRLDHRVTTEATLSYELQMVLTLLVQQLNVLRTRAGLAPLSGQDLRQAVQSYLRTHPKTPPGQGG